MVSRPKKQNRTSKKQKKEKRAVEKVTASFPIVAMGASAGGEAFSSLLRALPVEPGVALVFR